MPEPLFNRDSGSNEAAGDAVMSGRVTFTVERSLYDKIVQFSEDLKSPTTNFLLEKAALSAMLKKFDCDVQTHLLRL